MKSIRVFYKKTGRMRFVSHLDMNRLMIRILRLSKLPIWYTEGFNTHAYVTFALPLSLGFESEYEIMDFRLVDDAFPLDEVKQKLGAVMPEFIEIKKVCEPVKKYADVAFARFCIEIYNKNIEKPLIELLKMPTVIVQKATKKGGSKDIDLAEKIKEYSIENKNGALLLNITLPAGGADNINPSLIFTALKAYKNVAADDYKIIRKAVLDYDMELFE